MGQHDWIRQDFEIQVHANRRKRSLFRVMNEAKWKFLVNTPQKEFWLLGTPRLGKLDEYLDKVQTAFDQCILVDTSESPIFWF